MDEVTLVLSIEEYKKQLEEVSTSLHNATNDQKPQLEELQLNLIQLLELTLSQLENFQTVSPNTENGGNSSQSQGSEEDKLAREMALFKAEIGELSHNKKDEKRAVSEKLLLQNTFQSSVYRINDSESSSESSEIEEFGDVLNLLKKLEDKEVRAPFVERWGGHSYHNAVVLHPCVDKDGNPEIDDPKVVVLYSHPTSKAMLTCKYFLDDRCQFSDEECHFSHGVAVSVGDLREYSIQNPDAIVSGSRVLTCHSEDGLWHPGVVEDVLSERKGFSFKCDNCNIVVATELEMMQLLTADNDALQKSEKKVMKDTRLSKVSPEESDVEILPTERWLNTTVHQKLGHWEKYTKGVASRLMASMGYVEGTGLGPRGEGRIDPVPAYVYPQGVSLDHCMKLRLSSGGEQMLQVEKRLLKQQKKQEEKEKRKENVDIFSIINEKLALRKDKDTSAMSTKEMATTLKAQSCKELNRHNLQLNRSINNLENDLRKLEESRVRQKNDPSTVKMIESRIEGKREELRSMISEERSLHREQKKRKFVKDMSVF